MSCERYIFSVIKATAVTLICIFVILAVLGYLIMWLPRLPGPYHGVYLTHGVLGNIYEGLSIYDEEHGRLPAAVAVDPKSGEPASWRIKIYQWAFKSLNDNQFFDYDNNKAWNDKKNLKLAHDGAWLFRTTNDLRGRNLGKAGIFATYYKAITGPDTAFDPPTRLSLDQLPNDLILVVRVDYSDTHWMEPVDLSVEELMPSDKTKRLLLGKDGYGVLFADGEGWVLSDETPIEYLRGFFTISGAEKFNREQLLGPYRVIPDEQTGK